MFRQLNNRANRESGMVLITVLMVVAVMMVLSLGILSQNITQSTSSQAQVAQIRADELAKGIFWNAYSAGVFNSSNGTIGTYNGVTYSATVSNPSGNMYTVRISY